jgi:hypothetical protein
MGSVYSCLYIIITAGGRRGGGRGQLLVFLSPLYTLIQYSPHREQSPQEKHRIAVP